MKDAYLGSLVHSLQNADYGSKRKCGRRTRNHELSDLSFLSFEALIYSSDNNLITRLLWEADVRVQC